MPTPAQELFDLIGYQPHEGQRQFHASDARFKLLVAGARFGKSLASARDALAEALCGDSRGWLVAPTFALALPEYRYLHDDLIDRLSCDSDGETSRGRDGGSAISLPWGAEVLSISAQRPETLLGEELDWAILCEAAHIDPEVFERYLRPRLTTREGRLIVPTTPRGRNWIHDVFGRALAGKLGAWQAFHFATWDNPAITREEVESARQSLPPEVFDEQYGGAFTGRSGRVYPEFSYLAHVQADLRPPPGAIFFKAIDFGFANPFVCLWAVVDGEDRLLVIDEYRLAGATTDRHAREIKARDDVLVSKGFVRGPCWADPAGPMEREELVQAGIPAQAAGNALAPGINAVRERLIARKDGRPGLSIAAACKGLIREMELYHFEEGVAGSEPVPVKIDDHALDALRYLCLALKRRVDWREIKAGC